MRDHSELIARTSDNRPVRIICTDRQAGGTSDGKPWARIIALIPDKFGGERVAYVADTGHYTSAFGDEKGFIPDLSEALTRPESAHVLAREPTQEMLKAAGFPHEDRANAERWRRMYDAAVKESAPAGEVERIASVIHDAMCPSMTGEFAKTEDAHKDYCRKIASAILASEARCRELEEALREATGLDREIDHRLHHALIEPIGKIMRNTPENGGAFICADVYAPHYTASIDAALALTERLLPRWGFRLSVSEGYRYPNVAISRSYPTNLVVTVEAATAPLTILLALVSALLAQQGAKDSPDAGEGRT